MGTPSANSSIYGVPSSYDPVLVIHSGTPPTVPTVTVGDVSMAEGSPSGFTDVIFTLTLAEAAAVPITVAYQTADGTALAGADYQATIGYVTFNPGETEKTIVVRVIRDAALEADETFQLVLAGSANAAIADGAALASILNDD